MLCSKVVRVESSIVSHVKEQQRLSKIIKCYGFRREFDEEYFYKKTFFSFHNYRLEICKIPRGTFIMRYPSELYPVQSSPASLDRWINLNRPVLTGPFQVVEPAGLRKTYMQVNLQLVRKCAHAPITSLIKIVTVHFEISVHTCFLMLRFLLKEMICQLIFQRRFQAEHEFQNMNFADRNGYMNSRVSAGQERFLDQPVSDRIGPDQSRF